MLIKNKGKINKKQILFCYFDLMVVSRSHLVSHIGSLESPDVLFKETVVGTSLAVQWLRLWASTVGGTGSTPGQGTKIPFATWCSQK